MAHSPRSRQLIVIEITVVGVMLVIAAIILSVRAKRYGENPAICLNNVHQLVVVVSMTADGIYPDKATVWTELDYRPKALICPTYGAKEGNGYGYNTWLSNKVFDDFTLPPQELPVFADSANPDHLLNSNKDIDWRHNGKASVGYADGHVALIAPKEISIEKPKKVENH